MDILDEQDISAAEAKKILDTRKKDGTMTHEQKMCTEYLEKTQKMSKKQVDDLTEELKKVDILKPRYIALITNIMPDNEEEVDMLFSKERTNLKKEEIKKIVDIVKEFKK
ncbi:MAG: hypothetical protein HY831_04900 [Candidatus Aenigmarchaeota archaeon]|nr:hypothetical protein [Candidatus Aenigmarchaeota archaeon]